MANFKHTRVLMDKITIKGELSQDGKSIVYNDKDEGDVTVEIAKCLAPFAGEEISFSISTKDETDLDD
jgi:hypothetical protein